MATKIDTNGETDDKELDDTMREMRDDGVGDIINAPDDTVAVRPILVILNLTQAADEWGTHAIRLEDERGASIYCSASQVDRLIRELPAAVEILRRQRELAGFAPS